MKTILLLLIAFFPIAIIAQSKKEHKALLKVRKKLIKESSYVYIPAGHYQTGQSDSDLPYRSVVRSRTIHIDSFYMMEVEVSNWDYLTYINSIRKADSIRAEALLPDTLVWRSKYAYNEPYVEYYFRHPAYRYYPVVGVSYNKAVAYADWVTEQYHQREDREFKKVKFRLPTEEEWEYAARGGSGYSVFPWSGQNIINHKGQSHANFRYVNQSTIYRDTIWELRSVRQEDGSFKMDSVGIGILRSIGNSEYYSALGVSIDGADVTAPVRAYEPNEFGLFNMAGNVEEMVDAYYDRDPNVYEFSHDLKGIKAEDPSGITRGGSWRDTGFYCMVFTRQFYSGRDFSSNEIGFRLVMEVVEYW